MIQETSKHLSKLHHLMLCEGERDDTTLPLDLWRTDVRTHNCQFNYSTLFKRDCVSVCVINCSVNTHTLSPLSLQSMKEITGLPRSHVVEDFTSQLTAKMTEEGDSVRIPKVTQHQRCSMLKSLAANACQ